jgi:DNA-binding XRE family transcriptional regulator
VTPARFKEMREELGWTQSALASALGVSLRSIKYYEAGKVPVSRPVALLLESVHGVSHAQG